MFSVILYTLRQTLRRRAAPFPFPSFFPSYCDVSQARSYFASTIQAAQQRKVTWSVNSGYVLEASATLNVHSSGGLVSELAFCRLLSRI
jgi:hypothetical protein